jgi:endonuclease/exonuclease/phosphatase family metal-dependent hydrolase
MRIVSWNMNHCMRSVANRQRAWEYLQWDLAADLALVQEASPPDSLRSVYRALDETNPKLAWGSAVVSFRQNLTLKPRPRVALAECFTRYLTGDELPDSHPGACAVADVADENGRTVFTIVSLYGLWETIPDGRIYSSARLHRMISDLTGVFATQRRRPVIVAGDFNVTTQIAYIGQTKEETDDAAAVFKRLGSWGLVDVIAMTRSTRPKLANCTCPEPDSCAHVQTFRLRNRADSRPTQLDYAFVSGRLAKATRCEIVQTPEAWALSDHCPLVLEIEDDG